MAFETESVYDPDMADSSYRAEVPGSLPRTSEMILAGVRLPPGRLIVPDPSYADPSSATDQPVLWISNEALQGVGPMARKIATGFANHGLWPLVLESLRGADDRPWLSGELDPTASTEPDAHDPTSVLAEWWRSVIPDEDEDEEAFRALLPFARQFPGLAGAERSTTARSTALDDVLGEASGRLGLVAVTRPADALAVIGWQGPVNHYSDMGQLSAVLRSWEGRFGAYLVGVGFDTIALAVERPPRSIEAAAKVAAEHFAACSDLIFQGFGSIEAYARELAGRQAWSFWWD